MQKLKCVLGGFGSFMARQRDPISVVFIYKGYDIHSSALVRDFHWRVQDLTISRKNVTKKGLKKY